jgi:hypothetical protein
MFTRPLWRNRRYKKNFYGDATMNSSNSPSNVLFVDRLSIDSGLGSFQHQHLIYRALFLSHRLFKAHKTMIVLIFPQRMIDVVFDVQQIFHVPQYGLGWHSNRTYDASFNRLG